jgi:hypothetical protein
LLAFLDLSKAFARVWREGLFYLLWKNGIQGKCWKLLKSLELNFRFHLLASLAVIFRRVCSSCSDLPIKTISSTKRRQFIISEAKFCSDSILIKSFIKTEKRVGTGHILECL